MKRTIEDQFRGFHERHPDVYEEFVRLARDLRSKGHSHWSADAICHIIRWRFATSGHDEESGYKLNNNYTALYARMAMEQYDELEGFFVTRERKAA